MAVRGFDGQGNIHPGSILRNLLASDVGTIKTAANLAALPTTGNKIGDLGIDLSTDIIYYWDGTSWKTAIASPSGAGTDTPTKKSAITHTSLTGTTILTAPADIIIVETKLIVRTSFNGINASITVGDVGDSERLINTVQADPSTVGLYSTTVPHFYASGSNINFYINPGTSSTQGSGVILLTYVEAQVG